MLVKRKGMVRSGFKYWTDLKSFLLILQVGAEPLVSVADVVSAAELVQE